MRNIIAFSGKLGHGKDSFALELFNQLSKNHKINNIYKTAFANPIKEMFLNMFPNVPKQFVYGSSQYRSTIIPNCINYKTNNPLTIRDVLIDIGAIGRKYNENCWINAVFNHESTLYTLKYNGILIISDCRFINEVEYIHKAGGIVIRIIRPDVGFTTTDKSEIDLDNYNFDYTVVNDDINTIPEKISQVISRHIL